MRVPQRRASFLGVRRTRLRSRRPAEGMSLLTRTPGHQRSDRLGSIAAEDGRLATCIRRGRAAHVARGAWRVARGAWRVARGAWRRGQHVAPDVERAALAEAPEAVGLMTGAGALVAGCNRRCAPGTQGWCDRRLVGDCRPRTCCCLGSRGRSWMSGIRTTPGSRKVDSCRFLLTEFRRRSRRAARGRAEHVAIRTRSSRARREWGAPDSSRNECVPGR